MKKLLNGIVKFRKNVLPEYRDTFARLALGQSPDVLYIGCSDSRVAVNVFASTDPGDLFVVRNVGNLIPPYSGEIDTSSGESAAAAIEFAIHQLKVSHIIVCGHSECGAIQAVVNGRERVPTQKLRQWLNHSEELSTIKTTSLQFEKKLAEHNCLSQLNVLKQIENLKTYPVVKKALQLKQLIIHGWWFELKHADVYAYEEEMNRFVLIDETEAERILKRMEK